MSTLGKGKPTFEALTTTYFDISGEKPDLILLDCIKHQWGEKYTLVTKEGVQMEESTVTRSKEEGAGGLLICKHCTEL
jgi:hypothetical protein